MWNVDTTEFALFCVFVIGLIGFAAALTGTHFQVRSLSKQKQDQKQDQEQDQKQDEEHAPKQRVVVASHAKFVGEFVVVRSPQGVPTGDMLIRKPNSLKQEKEPKSHHHGYREAH